VLKLYLLYLNKYSNYNETLFVQKREENVPIINLSYTITECEQRF